MEKLKQWNINRSNNSKLYAPITIRPMGLAQSYEEQKINNNFNIHIWLLLS